MRYLYLLSVIIFLESCGGPSSQMVSITVIDQLSKQPIDSAAISLFRYYDKEEKTYLDTFWTNTNGEVAFSWKPEDGYTYGVKAERLRYQPSLLPSGAGYQNEAILQPGDTNQWELFLDPISAPDPERFARMHAEIPVKEVVAAIQTDSWTWTFLPRLTWEDVPALLSIADDSTFLHQYPKHPRSTYQPDSVRAGLTALWLVEAIRRQKNGAERPGALMPPSRTPVLGTRRGNPSGYNSIQQLQKAAQAYRNWWERYGQEPRKALRHNPLRGQGLSWM